MMEVPSICREQSRVAFRNDFKADGELEEVTARLEDYLNDKIQTRADLASLASLMENVELQKRQLEDQVCYRYPPRRLFRPEPDHIYSWSMLERSWSSRNRPRRITIL